MRKVTVFIFILVMILSCSPHADSPVETPTQLISPSSQPEPIVSPTAIKSSESAEAISTAIPSTITSLPPGVYPVTYSEHGFHIRSVSGEELAFIQSPGNGPGEANPDGQYLVITQPEVSLIDLYTGEIETYSEFLPGFYPAWSPDSQLIAYTSVEDGHDFASLFVLDLDSMDTQRLTFEKGFEEGPSWSPDGMWIAFASDAGDRYTGNTELYVLDVACIERGSCDEDPRRLEALPDNQYAGFPSWSPSGDQLIYLCRDEQGTSICLFDFSTSMSTELIRNVSIHSRVNWSPDGQWIGYTRQSAVRDLNSGVIYNLALGYERMLSALDRDEFFSTWIVVR